MGKTMKVLCMTEQQLLFVWNDLFALCANPFRQVNEHSKAMPRLCGCRLYAISRNSLALKITPRQ